MLCYLRQPHEFAEGAAGQRARHQQRSQVRREARHRAVLAVDQEPETEPVRLDMAAFGEALQGGIALHRTGMRRPSGEHEGVRFDPPSRSARDAAPEFSSLRIAPPGEFDEAEAGR